MNRDRHNYERSGADWNRNKEGEAMMKDAESLWSRWENRRLAREVMKDDISPWRHHEGNEPRMPLRALFAGVMVGVLLWLLLLWLAG